MNWSAEGEWSMVVWRRTRSQYRFIFFIQEYIDSRKRLHKSELKKHQRKRKKAMVDTFESKVWNKPDWAYQKECPSGETWSVHCPEYSQFQGSRVPVLRTPMSYWVPGVGATSLYVSLYREEAAIQLCGITASTDLKRPIPQWGQNSLYFSWKQCTPQRLLVCRWCQHYMNIRLPLVPTMDPVGTRTWSHVSYPEYIWLSHAILPLAAMIWESEWYQHSLDL